MVNPYQIPRNSLLWILIAQMAVIAPHGVRLSIWILMVCLGCGIWRILVYQGRLSFPGRWVKLFFVIGSMVGVPFSYKSILGLEPAVALLILAFVLKLLEMQSKRDAYLVILLAYFVSITGFLFSQTIPMAAYQLGVISLITASLVGLNQNGHVKPVLTLKKSLAMLLQATPLMLILFVLFPRLEPLWSVPLPSDSAKTGVTDKMSMGDIARLSQSDELAFRVTFEGPTPSPANLYWRGLVLSRFDGKTWSQSTRAELGRRSIEFFGDMNAPWDGLIDRQGEAVRYAVILEPTQQNWLFALPTMVPRTTGIGLVRDYRLYSLKPVRQKLRYKVTSYLDYQIEPELSEYWQNLLTFLPGDANPESRQLAKTLHSQSSSVEDYVAKVLQLYNYEEFVYTLQPPLLGKDPVDEFLIDTKKGFCEHYAGSFVFLMRAVGIPARVVVGYQGGEYNPVGNYLAVYQFDAHAWAEIWLRGKGWVRVDPTSAVAPERIEQGLEAAVESENTFLADSPLSWLRYRQTLWLTELRLQLSAMGHYWDSWVVGYDPSTQIRFLGQFFDEIDFKKMGLILLVSFFSVLAIISGFLVIGGHNGKSKVTPTDRQYLRFCVSLEKLGLKRGEGEAPGSYAKRVSSLRPDLKEKVDAVTTAYVALSYEDRSRYREKDLKKAVRTFRIKVLS